MFTGIITDIGKISELNFSQEKDCELAILPQKEILRSLDIGCSIACNGICLTLIKKEKSQLYFQASKETCEVTNIKNWRIGQEINIEFALRIGDELGGHMVSGHVDGCAKLKDLQPIQNSVKMTFELTDDSKNLAKFIAKKGSICLDGVSLTVNNSEENIFNVNIIEHSLQNTTLGALAIGDLVNVEIDLVARYILNKSIYEK